MDTGDAGGVPECLRRPQLLSCPLLGTLITFLLLLGDFTVGLAFVFVFARALPLFVFDAARLGNLAPYAAVAASRLTSELPASELAVAVLGEEPLPPLPRVGS